MSTVYASAIDFAIPQASSFSFPTEPQHQPRLARQNFFAPVRQLVLQRLASEQPRRVSTQKAFHRLRGLPRSVRQVRTSERQHLPEIPQVKSLPNQTAHAGRLLRKDSSGGSRTPRKFRRYKSRDSIRDETFLILAGLAGLVDWCEKP
jgi:hypothetical protein